MHNSITSQWTRFTPLLGLAVTLLAAGCDQPASPERSAVGRPNFSHTGAQPWDSGVGTLGTGSATPGSDRQEFNFDVGAELSGGQLFYRDWSVVRSNGTVGTLTVDPTDASTAITTYRDWAGPCADPTRGAAFDGTGRLDTGELISFTLSTCDNGTPGSGTDFLQMDVPSYSYSHGRVLSSGDVAKSGTATIIFQDGFEGPDLSQWRQYPDSAGRYSLAAAPSLVHSGTQSLQALFDTIGPYGGYGLITRGFTGQDDVYFEFYVMFDTSFVNQRPDGFGMHFLTICGDVNTQEICADTAGVRPNGAYWFYAGVDPEGDSVPHLGPFHFYTYWPDMQCPANYLWPAVPCYGNDSTQIPPKIPLVGREWQQVVFHIKMNTVGQYDGSQELWINGVKKIDMQNMRWRTVSNLKTNEIRFDDYMGDHAKKREYLWIDDLTVWRP